MCGREPNFELPEEEKQELRRYKWDEFLAITRSAINNKKHKRVIASGGPKVSEPTLHNNDWNVKQEADGSASDDGDSDSSDS
uniref:Ethylene-responsive transcription factor-like protein At4g13040 n=1 Tax=Rhizophora mucronata TaxID=61149 RepID=A0A2P2P267_RHIMU